MKKFLISTLAVILVLSAYFTMLSNSGEAKLYALGYDEKEVQTIINTNGVLTAAQIQEGQLDESISKNEEILNTKVGVSSDLIVGKDKMTKVEYDSALATFIETSTQVYMNENEILKNEMIKLNIVDEIDEETTSLNSQFEQRYVRVEQVKAEHQATIADLKQQLVNLGVRQTKIDSLVVGDSIADIEALTAEVTYYNNLNARLSTAGNSYATGNMELYNQINDYRVTLGLPRLAYNYDKQSCVDMEANAYANTQIPHNWVCDVANEGASLASVKSDYVRIASNFFTTHGSHRQTVISTSYTSMACSIVNKGNMNYMICGYFY